MLFVGMTRVHLALELVLSAQAETALQKVLSTWRTLQLPTRSTRLPIAMFLAGGGCLRSGINMLGRALRMCVPALVKTAQ